jgi:AraC-like DNA-binding protein
MQIKGSFPTLLKRQTFFARNLAPRDTSLISAMGQKEPNGPWRFHPEWSSERQGNDWSWCQVNRQSTFSMVAGERFHTEARAIAYTRWESYIKVNFFLAGRQTTVLDGFGQHDHELPEVFIVSGPPEMIKIDVEHAGTRTASLALCLLRDFFPVQLGIAVEDLPEPIRTMASPRDGSYAFYRFPLRTHLLDATRSVFAAPPSVRGQPAYSNAKAVELMCLLIEHLSDAGKAAPRQIDLPNRHRSSLRDARELISKRYAEDLTLDSIAREVGLNRMALTSGFRRLFAMSVHECLERRRMEEALRLLQEGTDSISRIAEAVGYSHLSTFSAAFHAYFGCSPKTMRTTDRQAAE